MAGRKIRSAEEARDCLAEAAKAGVNRATWAREHGIDGRSLNAWRMNLERTTTAAEASPLRLVELVAAGAKRPAPMYVRCGPFELELAPDFDEATLGRLLGVLASC